MERLLVGLALRIEDPDAFLIRHVGALWLAMTGRGGKEHTRFGRRRKDQVKSMVYLVCLVYWVYLVSARGETRLDSERMQAIFPPPSTADRVSAASIPDRALLQWRLASPSIQMGVADSGKSAAP